jgi:hypothetical protein
MAPSRLDMPEAISIALRHCVSIDTKDEVTPEDVELFSALSTLVFHARDTKTNALIDLALDAQIKSEQLLTRLTKG